MAPRRGGRKVGLKRIDAAIDALVPLGFTRSLICKTIENLLNVYDGDAGWVFIEEASYKLVIETILEQQENSSVKKDEPLEGQSQVPQLPSSTDENHCSATSCSNNRMELQRSFPDQEKTERETGNCSQMMEEEQLLPMVEKHMPPVQEKKMLPIQAEPARVMRTNAPFPRTRPPCFGWISEDEEEENSIVDEAPKRCRDASYHKYAGRRRKSGWDVKPPDM